MQWTEVLDKFENAMSYLCNSNLTQIFGVSLGEFGQNMKSVGVSATTGEGMDAFLMAMEASAKDSELRTYMYSSNQYMLLLFSEYLLHYADNVLVAFGCLICATLLV